jgi:hypothetical protein
MHSTIQRRLTLGGWSSERRIMRRRSIPEMFCLFL